MGQSSHSGRGKSDGWFPRLGAVRRQLELLWRNSLYLAVLPNNDRLTKSLGLLDDRLGCLPKRRVRQFR